MKEKADISIKRKSGHFYKLATEEMAEMISSEVKKQMDPMLKQIPAIRKGLIEQDPQGDELNKTFEGLPPQKKLKVALALQQA